MGRPGGPRPTQIQGPVSPELPFCPSALPPLLEACSQAAAVFTGSKQGLGRCGILLNQFTSREERGAASFPGVLALPAPPSLPVQLLCGDQAREGLGADPVSPWLHQMLAKHVITLHVSALTQTQAVEGEVDLAKLKKFIAYCRA